LACAGTSWGAIEYSQATLPAPGYYVNAYGGLGGGYSPSAGSLFSPDYLNSSTVSYNSDYHDGSLVNGTVFSTTSYANAAQNVSGSAHGTTGFGLIKLYADYAAPNTAAFPAFRATGGWNDSITIVPSNPALNGTAGSFTATLHLDGQLQALAGFNSSAGFQITGYKNGNVLPGTWIYTYSGQGQIGFPYNQAVNTDVTFAVPFTFGQPFTFGFYGLAWARTASAASVPGLNTGFADFDHTVTWQGITNVTSGSNPAAYSLTSATGLDWSSPVTVPEPASTTFLLLGVAATAQRRRRQADIHGT
jgi:hypothetical protein